MTEIRAKREPLTGPGDPWVYGTHRDLGDIGYCMAEVAVFGDETIRTETSKFEIHRCGMAARNASLSIALKDAGFCPKTVEFRFDPEAKWERT